MADAGSALYDSPSTKSNDGVPNIRTNSQGLDCHLTRDGEAPQLHEDSLAGYGQGRTLTRTEVICLPAWQLADATRVAKYVKTLQRYVNKQPRPFDDAEKGNLEVARTVFEGRFERRKRYLQQLESGMGAEIAMDDAQVNRKNSERSTKLAYLAAIYLPLRLATGIFGMNLREIGEEKGPRWCTCISMAAVLIMLTVILM